MTFNDVWSSFLAATTGRAQVQQEQLAETTEGTSINTITPQHTVNRGHHLVLSAPGMRPCIQHARSQSYPSTAGPTRVAVSAGRLSVQCPVARLTHHGDVTVYYCAMGDMERGDRAAARHKPPQMGPGMCVGGDNPGGSATQLAPASASTPALTSAPTTLPVGHNSTEQSRP